MRCVALVGLKLSAAFRHKISIAAGTPTTTASIDINSSRPTCTLVCQQPRGYQHGTVPPQGQRGGRAQPAWPWLRAVAWCDEYGVVSVVCKAGRGNEM